MLVVVGFCDGFGGVCPWLICVCVWTERGRADGDINNKITIIIEEQWWGGHDGPCNIYQ